ncbi:uncharacterized protein K452DRAFT_295046 [Aplosporella prunicola CBS 121167]|uniref:C2H2-type domain-containing protein n=1 Tax=Aplosporella prunicola CBS 121167 TaxID=1176127 RepID=A0A6A6BS49_9PEZI|nr:uncharacterized protein K452DRAFT_295046 [Aplosporella prunicola CBS 121167]KAF2145401.1 hypothetical protein K452DRAFT_295046 [Aplosporella prunicola CBS 121167]
MSNLMEDEMMEDFIPLECDWTPEEEEQGKTSHIPTNQETSAQSLKAHFQATHPEVEVYDFQCVCGRYFKAQKDMRAHQKSTGHGACVCGENFSSYAELHRHRYEAVHFIRCSCTRIFGSTQHLLSHQRLERHDGFRDAKNGPEKLGPLESTTLDEVLCPCGGQLRDSTPTTTATASCSGGGEASPAPPLRCSDCSRVFQDAYGPARDSYAPGTTAFACRNCARAFKTWDAMWQHQLFIHHPCIACHHIFVSEARLMAHQRATGHCHCAACDAQFMTPDRLRQHLLEAHGVSRTALFQDVLAEERPLEAAPRSGGGGGGGGSSSHQQQEEREGDEEGGAQIFKGGFKAGANFLHISLRCRICGQDFTSPKTLHDHRTRGWHDPFASVACPFAACPASGKTFPSVSALLHHLEHGHCASGICTPVLNALLRGGPLERFVLPEYQLRPSPESPVSQRAADVNAAVAAAAAAAVATTTTPDEHQPPELRCPFCPSAAYPSPAQLKAHLSMYNHTPRFLAYPAYVAAPRGKSQRKSAVGFNAWSALAHSLETLLCAGSVAGVQEALDCVEARLRALAVVGEEADVMVD